MKIKLNDFFDTGNAKDLIMIMVMFILFAIAILTAALICYLYLIFVLTNK
jgi:hypothetical protein